MVNNVHNELYSSNNIKDGWKYTDDLQSYTQWALDLTKTSGQVVPLVFNSTYQNFKLNLQAIPGNIGAYPFIRYIDISAQKAANYIGDRDLYTLGFNNFSQTFPASSTTTQQSNVTNLDQLKKLLLNTIPAGVTITDIQIGVFGSGSFVDLFPGNITAGGTSIDLESYFGARGASAGFQGAGFTIKITANNTNGTSQNINATLYGVSKGFQNNVWLIDYQDAYNNLHRIGTFNDAIISKFFPVERLINVPLTDPTNPNFGTLLFTLQRTDNTFTNLETYDIVVSLSIAYLLSNQVTS